MSNLMGVSGDLTKNWANSLIVLHRTPTILVVQTTAGMFDKFGSNDVYGQFNLGLHVDDIPSDVLVHRAKLLDELNQQYRVDCLHWLNQIHSDIVVNIDESVGIKALTADALMTHKAGHGLAIMTADCVPVAVFADGDDQDAPIACIHAGWQGLSNGVIAKTIATIRQTHPKTKLHAIIGACISQNSYEITRKLADDIVGQVCVKQLTHFDELDLYHAIIKDGKSCDKCLIDLDKLARFELEKLGVSVLNDDIPCTYNDTRFYSYRAQTHAKKPATGRMALVVVRL